MIYSDQRRLFDITTRAQIAVESYKAWQVKEFEVYARELQAEFTKLLGRLPYSSVGSLTKAQLIRLIVAIKKSQDRIYSDYLRKLLKQLRDFMDADLVTLRRAYASAFWQPEPEDKEQAPSDRRAIAIMEEESQSLFPLFGIAAVTTASGRLWAAIANNPIPANGMLLEKFLATFSLSARGSVENLIRRAWANNDSVAHLTAELTGVRLREGTGQIDRIRAQNDAVVRTAIQMIHVQTQAGVLSSMFARYVWNSVIDNATTDICRSRDGKIFKFGEGPLPPAHIRCRSHIAPVTGKTGDWQDPPLILWLKGQPLKIQRLLLNEQGAQLLNSGDLKAKELHGFFNSKPADVEEFKSFLSLILYR